VLLVVVFLRFVFFGSEISFVLKTSDPWKYFWRFYSDL